MKSHINNILEVARFLREESLLLLPQLSQRKKLEQISDGLNLLAEGIPLCIPLTSYVIKKAYKQLNKMELRSLNQFQFQRVQLLQLYQKWLEEAEEYIDNRFLAHRGERYYIPSPYSEDLFLTGTWQGDEEDLRVWQRGLVFRCEEQAKAKAKLMLEVL